MKTELCILALLIAGLTVRGEEAAAVALPQGTPALVNGCFNAPDSKLSGWRLRSGNLGSFMITAPQEGSPDPVLTMKVTEANPKPWMMELHQSVKTTVEKGCTMYITFEYKMTKGYSFQFYWQVERAPWPKLLSMRLTTPENAWHRIRVAAPVHETYAPETTAFSFHLAEAPGILQLRNMYAVMVPNETNPETLETNETAVLGGDFYDREWREKVTNRMKQTRRAPVTVQVFKRRPKSGKSVNHPPAANAIVIMKQLSRPFEVGVSAPVGLLYPELLSRPEHQALQARLGEHAPAAAAFRSHVLGNPLFEVFTDLSMLGWRQYPQWGKDIEEKLLADLAAGHLSFRGGPLFDPLFSMMPEELRGQERATVSAALSAHIEETVKRLAGKTGGWAVVHDAIAHTEVYSYLGVDCLPQAFAAARRGDAAAKLLLSDSFALNAISEIPLQDLVELGTWLTQTAHAPVDGLLLDACMRRLDVGPQTLERRLDAIAGALPGMPIHIINLAVNMEKDDLQAEMLRDYLLLCYSHPQVASVSLGQLWTPAAELPALGYLNADYTPRRSWQMIQKLFTEEWMSAEELKTDAAGAVACTPFGGKYDIAVTLENMSRRFLLEIPEGKALDTFRGSLQGDGVYASYHPKKGFVINVYLDAGVNEHQQAKPTRHVLPQKKAAEDENQE